MLGVKHHLLIRPLCRQLGVSIGRIEVGRLWGLIRLLRSLLRMILVERRVKWRRGYVWCPAALRLLLDGVCISRLLLCRQQHLLLLLMMQELLLLLLLLLRRRLRMRPLGLPVVGR